MTASEADPTIAELSEGEILRRILARTGQASGATVGPGDDAAVLADAGPVVVSTDTLVHGPDFRLAWSSGYDLGWKAAAVNLADIAAMGARPTALLVALAMPETTRIGFVEALADGLREGCAVLAPGCAVVGGDLTVSPTLTIAVTALGALDGRAAVLRAGARPGDVVAVAGELGVAAAGLGILFSRFTDAAGEPTPVDSAALTPDEERELVAQLRPTPPVGLGAVAAAAGARALMDVSDGLGLDATRMADASGVTIRLDTAALGRHRDAASLERSLRGGEDHALLATFPADAPLPDGFRRIGTVDERGAAPLVVDGAPFEGHGGWDPYRDWDRHGG